MLTYVQELEGTGLTREQAAAIARGSAVMLDERIEELVTKPHFDSEITRIDERFDRIERRIDRLEALIPEVRLHTWMLALLIAALVVPKLQLWFAT